MRSRIILTVLSGLLIAGLAAFFLISSPAEVVVSAQRAVPHIEADGGGSMPTAPSDLITQEQRDIIQKEIRDNMAMLERQGRLAPASPEVVALSWPVRKAANATDFNIEGISNYVDQNAAFPNQLLDWNCGNRTYDQSSGYNHSGIDIFTWPFGWRKMDLFEVDVVAAAPGTIVNKADGNFDRNCGFGSGNWNAIYVRHADNSIAWYGHMKNGSLNSKIVGDTVVTGERLGTVGSSGNSTGPHLHFELYNASGQLQEPYQGTCNTLNNFTWWAAQEPYRVTRMNQLLTQSSGPIFPTCPAQETTNEKNVFRTGETLTAAGYFRDQLVGNVTQYSLIRPDGAVDQSWSHSSPDTYAASYWFFTRALSASSPRGAWKLRSVFNSTTYEHNFSMVANIPFDYDGDRRSDISVYRPGATGTWYVQRSTAGPYGIQFGTATDKITPADFDADFKTDIAVYRPSEGRWYVFNSLTSTVTTSLFGAAADIPVPGDYDNDGRADIGIFRPSDGNWWLNRSTAGPLTTQFGQNGDVLALGDYDGDGRADLAVFRPSTGVWYIRRSTAGDIGYAFGFGSDKITPADYDADGKTDIAVYRPSTGQWFIANSGSATYPVHQFGASTDVPVPADYDGDGRADIAIFRPSDGNWWIQRTAAGLTVLPFGQNGDRPTPNAFGN
jgi:murein DD-endopeptidase MepM/ murein hydrolase activator NlpD